MDDSDALLPLGDDDTPRKARRRAPFLVPLVLLLVAGLALVGGRVVLDQFRTRAAPDYDGQGTGEVVVQVLAGSSAGDIGTLLAEKDVVKSRAAFVAAANDDDRSRGIQPGFYRLRLQMSAAAALELMLSPDARVRSRFTIPEGTTATRTLEIIAKSVEDLPLPALRQAAANPAALGLPDYAQGRLEGLLFPATYDVEPGSTAVEVLTMMVDRFEEVAAEADLVARAQALGRTPYEIVTIGSLVEAETPKDSDRGKVAQVVYNRLERGMKLDFDSTVKYVFELRGERKTRILNRDLQVDSPYNTYRNRGLPPTPINSPGEAALLAALEPEDGPWLFFVVADKEGNSAFAATYEEHQRNVERYRREVQGQG
jgi:UPF0755 protein